MYVSECVLIVITKMRAFICLNALYDIFEARDFMFLNALYII